MIVCPASLIEQWQKEIENRVKRNHLAIALHHGNNRESRASKLSKNDVVVTTYGLVASELKNSVCFNLSIINLVAQLLEKPIPQYSFFRLFNQGTLHNIKWERVVLDEAHVIRNYSTAASIACSKLKGTKRWALTGTPVQNKETDVYSLLKFIKCTPFNELAIFKKWMNTNTAGGRDRLTNVLKPLLLRRTKLELQDKGELQSLPEKTLEMVKVVLSTNEMNVYSKILTYSKQLFSDFLAQRASSEHRNNMGLGLAAPHNRKREPNEAYHKMHDKFSLLHANNGMVKSSQILVLITRLRQICNHPGLIDKVSG